MGHVLWIIWNWPNGIVVGNLMASAFWATPALWHLHAKLNRHHKQRGENLMNIHQILHFMASRMSGLNVGERDTLINDIGKLADTAVPAAAPAVAVAEHVAEQDLAAAPAPADPTTSSHPVSATGSSPTPEVAPPSSASDIRF